jgi:rfaE bifunctional protein kinase chain/domain
VTASEIDTLFAQFPLQTALVIGDVMVDSYVWGKVERMSPEAPVPVLNVEKKENRLGGSANVALNLAALKATPVICSVIGNDRMGEVFIHLLKEKGMTEEGIVRSANRITTVKTRIISSNKHMLRMDEEETNDLSQGDEQSLLHVISHLLETKKITVVVFEDYNKGVITEQIISTVISLCNEKGIPTCVDPKKNNFFSYKNVTLFKPNLKELKEGLKKEINLHANGDLSKAVSELHEILHHEISLITLSENGVLVKRGNKESRFAAHQRNITDVSGAGDTVIAVAALCVALKTDADLMAQLSNLAGGLVCEQTGVVPVQYDQLLTESKNKLVH